MAHSLRSFANGGFAPRPPTRALARRFAASLRSRGSLATLVRCFEVRSIDTRNILKVEFADDQYARQFADRLLATRIMTGFGLLAFVVAAAGIYGVMAFLVANRAREIGIRMALGADSRRIRRLVLESSMWLVFLGAAIGIGGALVASRWAQSQLFGVSAMDPMTIGLVTFAVVVTAFLAT